MEEKAEKRENKKNWIVENIYIILIMIFSFIVLYYFFGLTKNQTLWWDEAEYMSTAKYWAFDSFKYVNSQRPPLLSFLAFILYKIGVGDIGIKFFAVFLPAWLSILAMYLLIKEMYDKKTALIASFILSVSWIHLFYAMRFMTDSLGFLFGVLAFFCFWKGYVNKGDKKYIWFIGVFIALSFMSRLTGVLYGGAILIYLLFTERLKFLKNKNLWIAVALFLIVISPYLIWLNSEFGNIFAFRSGYSGPENSAPGWWMLNLVYDYPELVFFIAFLLGIGTLVPMILGIDLILRKKESKHNNDFFMIIALIATLIFFIFFVRLGENRWPILISIAIFAISAKGIVLIHNSAEKNFGKIIALILLVLILFGGAYFQLNHANNIIKGKVDSYLPVKEAAVWMKENSNINESIFTISYTQTIFYSDRRIYTYSGKNSEEEFEAYLKEIKPRYIVVSIFEPHPEWAYNPSEKLRNYLAPAKVWYGDSAQTQPVLIIYQSNL